MTEHKFKIAAGAPSGLYQITRRLRAVDEEFQYAIKSAYKDHERVATASELIRV